MKFSVTGKWHSDRHGYRGQEREGYGSPGNAYQSLGDYRKALEYHEKNLKIATEIGDQAGVRAAYCNNAIQFIFVEEIENAVDNFVSAVDALNSLRSLQNWKINFRELHEKTYTAVWVSLLRIKKIDEALFAAEQGRAQTLSDNLLLQYKLINLYILII